MLYNITMEKLKGVIIEESLKNNFILKEVKIISTKVEIVTEKHKSSVKQWTLHTIEIDYDKAEGIAVKLSFLLEDKWYADFKNEYIHYVIYQNKIFKIDRTKEGEYNEATKYGISIGIPNYQVDFAKNVKKWGR